MIRKILEKLGPVYAAIIRQGVEDGVFNTPFPDEVGELILNLWFSLGDVSNRLLIGLDQKPENLKILETKLRIYENTTERILGAKSGCLFY
jgi:hypothetical protein